MNFVVDQSKGAGVSKAKNKKKGKGTAKEKCTPAPQRFYQCHLPPALQASSHWSGCLCGAHRGGSSLRPVPKRKQSPLMSGER